MRLYIFLYVFLFFFSLQARTQVDSLDHILASLQKETENKELKQALQEVKILYEPHNINDSLSQKLLHLSGLILKSITDEQQILSYCLAVTDVLQRLPPERAHLDYALSLDHLADAYKRLGMHDKALTLYFEAIAIREKQLGQDHLSYATSLHKIADIYFNRDQFDTALVLYQKELLIQKEKVGENNYDYVNCLISLSWSHNYIGNYDTALFLSQNVLVSIKRIPKEKVTPTEHANILMNIARLYHRMGQYDRSLLLYEEALAMKKIAFGQRHFRYAFALVDVAYFHHRILGDYKKALLLYEEALPIIENTVKEKGSEKSSIVETLEFMYRLNLSHLGTVYYLLKEYDKALTFYEKAVKLFPEHPDCITNLARVYYDVGRRDSALSLCRQTLLILEERKAKGFRYNDAANDLATLYYTMGMYADAFQLFEKCSIKTKQIWGKENLHYASSLNRLGMVYIELGDHAQAALLFDEATKITLNYLSRTYSTLSEQEKIAVVKKLSYQFDFLPSLLFSSSEPRSAATNKLYENVIALKGMVLEDQQAVLSSIRKSGDSSVLQLYFKWYKHKAFVGTQQLLPLASRVPYLDSIENIANQLEQELSRHSLIFRNQHSRGISANDLSRKLLPGQATIEFIRFQLHNKKWTDDIWYAALVLLPDDNHARFIPLFEEKQLQTLLRPYAGTTTGYDYIKRLYGSGVSIPASSNNLNDSLYKLIWKPLENHLKDAHTIYYAPAGLLHRIAFNSLRYDASHHLIDKYRLNQVLNTRSVVSQTKELQKPLSAAVWGDIDYDLGYADNRTAQIPKTRSLADMNTTESIFDLYTNDTRGDRKEGWSSLSYTKKEMGSVKKAIEKSVKAVSVVSGQSATEDAFKALNGKSPQLLHVATHGFFLSIKENQLKNSGNGMDNGFTLQQNPMFRSGMVLAGGNHAWKGGKIPQNSEDGILTAYEIAQLDLSNVELLVLSACETALGETKYANEGVFGLQRAFKLAGVKKMIMSLWQVPDKQSAELINLFYNNWIKGQTIRESLYNAQMTMKQKYPPFYWAAFVVVE